MLPDIKVKRPGNSSNMRQLLGGPPKEQQRTSSRHSNVDQGGQGFQRAEAQRAGSPRLSVQSEKPRAVKATKKNFHYQRSEAHAQSEIMEPIGGSLEQVKEERALRFPPILNHSATVNTLGRNIEYETRIEAQERLTLFMNQQVNSLESQINSVLHRQAQQLEGERESKRRLEQSLRVNEEKSQLASSDFSLRLSMLEEQVTKVEEEKSELVQKLQQSELKQKEIMQYVRQIQQQENTEMNQVRAILQDRLSQEQMGSIKQKEKSAALFTEVVRLGETQSKTEEQVQKLHLAIESRIQTFQEKISINEKLISNVEKLQQVGQNTSGRDYERLLQRLDETEKQLMMLSNESQKGKETLSRLEVVSLKHNQDFKSMLGNLQAEFAGRLSGQITDLVGKILTEQDSRNRAIEDIRHQVEIKERFSEERVRQEYEKAQERYNSMDMKVAAEFQRKDEVIQNLRDQIEATGKAVQGWLKQEELQRGSLEQAVRQDLNRFSEQIRLELDSNKADEKVQTEAITGALKNEADLRLVLERESKQLIQSLVSSLTNDFKTFKELVESTQDKLQNELHELAQQTSDNSHFLSRYVDEEVEKVSERSKQQYERLKGISAKLTEQFKQHLINNERYKNESDKRLSQVEQQFPQQKAEVLSNLESAESRLIQKITEAKNLLDSTSLANLRSLEERIELFANNVDQNVGLLRRAIQQNRETMVGIINEQRDVNNARFTAVTSDLQALASSVAQSETELEKVKEETQGRDEELSKGINELGATVFAAISAEGGKAEGEMYRRELDMSSKMKAIEKSISELMNQISELVDQTDVEKDMAGAAIKSLQEELQHHVSELKGFYKADAVRNRKGQDFKSKTEDAVQELESNESVINQQIKDLILAKEKLEDLEKTMEEQNKANEARMVGVEEDNAKVREEAQEKVKKIETNLEEIVDRKLLVVKEELKKQSNKIWEENLKGNKSPGPQVMQGRSELHSLLGEVPENESLPKPQVKKP